MPKITVHERRTRLIRCAFCHDLIRQRPWICDGCDTRLHRSCRRELETCPSLGCEPVVTEFGLPDLIFWIFFALMAPAAPALMILSLIIRSGSGFLLSALLLIIVLFARHSFERAARPRRPAGEDRSRRRVPRAWRDSVFEVI